MIKLTNKQLAILEVEEWEREEFWEDSEGWREFMSVLNGNKLDLAALDQESLLNAMHFISDRIEVAEHEKRYNDEKSLKALFFKM